MKQLYILTSLLLISFKTVHASGFENAFKQALKNRNSQRRQQNREQQPNAIPMAQASWAHDQSGNIPQATAQIKEKKEYVSIRPEIQQVVLAQLKQEGKFDAMGLQVASTLIKYYQELQNKRTPYTIDSIREDELNLVPHLLSVCKHLNEAQQTPQVLATQQQLQNIIQQINR